MVIEIKQLIFDYEGFRALHNLDITIHAGSVTALVGANGSGKTTLMRCIVGLLSPIAGEIYVNGINMQEAPRVAHQYIGYLSDAFGLDRELTVEQCLMYTAAIQNIPKAHIVDAIESTLTLIDLHEKRTAKTKTLSRGQRQRVALGQAIIHNPKLLVLDEPASGLDPEQRGNLAKIFTQLNQQGMTILVSSHILSELDEYSSHLLVLQKGRIVEHRSLAGDNSNSLYRLSIVDYPQCRDQVAQSVVAFSTAQNQPITVLHEDGVLLFETPMDERERGLFLKYLMEQQLLVSECAPYKRNLKTLYQHSVAGEGRP